MLCGRLRSGDQGLDECFPGVLFKVVLPNNALGGGYRGELQLPSSAAVILSIKPPLRKGPETCPFQWSVNCTLYSFLLAGLLLLRD